MKNSWIFVAGIAFASQLVLAETTLKHDDFAGVTLYYKVITPKDYDPAKEYPAVLAFPGGAQTMPMVDGMIARNLGLQAAKRGYIVVVCSATLAFCGAIFVRGRGSRVPGVSRKSFLRIIRFAEGSFTLPGFRMVGRERVPYRGFLSPLFLFGDGVSRVPHRCH